MAIGALGIKNMVKSGGVLTIYITVPLTILEAFLKDHSSIYVLAGNLTTDLIKVGIGSVIMAIGGLGISVVTTSVAAPIAVAIVTGIFANEMLDSIDRQYKLTQKLVEGLESMAEKINKATTREAETVKDSVVRGFDGFIRGQGLKIPRY
jgi:acetylglutamate synthase